MYYIVGVNHKDMEVHPTGTDCERFLRNAAYPVEWMGLMICCEMAVMIGNVTSVKKTLTVQMETVTLTDKGRENVTCFVD
jgi:ribulose 1,5-bisphosphate carboxylase large subunit-like protein